MPSMSLCVHDNVDCVIACVCTTEPFEELLIVSLGALQHHVILAQQNGLCHTLCMHNSMDYVIACVCTTVWTEA